LYIPKKGLKKTKKTFSTCKSKSLVVKILRKGEQEDPKVHLGTVILEKSRSRSGVLQEEAPGRKLSKRRGRRVAYFRHGIIENPPLPVS
jgi:hypothetical protein